MRFRIPSPTTRAQLSPFVMAAKAATQASLLFCSTVNPRGFSIELWATGIAELMLAWVAASAAMTVIR
jgi:hypothetical protein